MGPSVGPTRATPISAELIRFRWTSPRRAGTRLILALGKDGKANLLDRSNLGGIGGSLAVETVDAHAIVTADFEFCNSLLCHPLRYIFEESNLCKLLPVHVKYFSIFVRACQILRRNLVLPSGFI